MQKRKKNMFRVPVNLYIADDIWTLFRKLCIDLNCSPSEMVELYMAGELGEKITKKAGD